MAGSVPEDLKYTKDHEWVRQQDGSVVVVGVTDHAQRQLGEIVYIELPNVDDRVEASEPFGSLESVKAVTEVYAPVTGQVIAVNAGLAESPEDINDDPYGEGWLIQIRMTNAAQVTDLLTPAKYAEYSENSDD